MKHAVLLAATFMLSFAPDADATNSNRGKDRDRQSTQARASYLRGVHGERLGPAITPDTTLGGNFSNPYAPRVSADVEQYGLYNFTLNDPGSGWQENFLLGLPANPVVPAPVLVMFHGYGETPHSVLENTSYFQMAMARGWIVVAPMGAHEYNYGIEYSQLNVEKVMEWVSSYLTVDVDRFYAVGFSMGGGAAASYAARHLDPSHARFASVVVHTGTTSLRDCYWTASVKNLFENDLMFGGSPDQEPFAYQRASSIDLDTFTGSVDQDADMARNLSHISIRNFNAIGDPNQNLVGQTAMLHNQLVLRVGSSVYEQGDGTTHNWGTLDEKAVLDYFATISYQEPASGTFVRTLADRDGGWHSFDLEQEADDQFSPFRWIALPEQNRLVLDEMANIQELSVDPEYLELDPSTTLQVMLESADDTGIEFVLEGIDLQPSDVLRNGQSTGSWDYDASERTLTLHEDGEGSYPMWTVVN